MEADIEYVFVETDFAKTYRKQLQAKYQHSTFPIVVREDKSERLIIGGYDELLLHLKKRSG